MRCPPRSGSSWRHVALRTCALVVLALSSTTASAAVAGVGDYGTISAVDATGVITILPWGKTAADAKTIATDAETAVNFQLTPGAVKDLQSEMWIKLDEVADGKAKKLSAGRFLSEDGDKVVIFKGMPEEFVLYNNKPWYTNSAGGCKFKVQAMGGGEDTTNGGMNLRSATYQEPAGGFVVYWPLTIKGAALGWGGPKPGANVPDDQGRVFINKDTVTDYYWKHLANPARPEAGYTTGMTEFTIRHLPKR